MNEWKLLMKGIGFLSKPIWNSIRQTVETKMDVSRISLKFKVSLNVFTSYVIHRILYRTNIKLYHIQYTVYYIRYATFHMGLTRWIKKLEKSTITHKGSIFGPVRSNTVSDRNRFKISQFFEQHFSKINPIRII